LLIDTFVVVEKNDKSAHQSCQKMQNDEDKTVPSTLNSMHSLSTNYSGYMASLKGGASSGITDTFGMVTLAEASSRLNALSQRLKALSEETASSNSNSQPTNGTECPTPLGRAEVRETFSVDDKVGAVYAILSGALNVQTVAETYGTTPDAITRWVEVACRAIEDSLRDVDGAPVTKPKTTVKTSISASSEESIPSDHLSSRNESAPPVHFAIMSIAAEYQKYYVNSLKEGNRSGISDRFGNAASILVPPIPEPTPISNDRDLEPKNVVDFNEKAQKLQDSIRIFCEQFLSKFLDESRQGKHSTSLQALLNRKPDQLLDVEKVFLKELVCASLFISVLDQGDIELVPEWVQSFLGRAFFKSSQIIKTPSVEEIMQTYSSMEDYEVCRLIAERCIKRLGLKDVPDSAVLPVYEFLYRSGPQRRELIQEALE
jgi:transposase-like protein